MWTETQREEGRGTTEAEIGVMQLQAGMSAVTGKARCEEDARKFFP